MSAQHLRLVPAVEAIASAAASTDTDWAVVDHAITAAALAQDWRQGLDHKLSPEGWALHTIEASGQVASSLNQWATTGQDRHRLAARAEAMKTAAVALALVRRLDEQDR